MSGPTTPRWRAARAGTFAAVAALLAMMGHAVGGGGLPDPSVVLIPALVLGFVTTSIGHRPRPFGQVLAALAIGQLAFHLLFSVSAHAGPILAGEHLDLPRMITFHVLGAAGSALIVARGEAALFRLFAAVRRLVVPAPRAAPVDLRMPWTALMIDASAGGLGGWLPSSIPRRGPPSR